MASQELLVEAYESVLNLATREFVQTHRPDMLHDSDFHARVLAELQNEVPFAMFEMEYELGRKNLARQILRRKLQELLEFGVYTVIGFNVGIVVGNVIKAVLR